MSPLGGPAFKREQCGPVLSSMVFCEIIDKYPIFNRNQNRLRIGFRIGFRIGPESDSESHPSDAESDRNRIRIHPSDAELFIHLIQNRIRIGFRIGSESDCSCI